jgi:hypothetical protein
VRSSLYKLYFTEGPKHFSSIANDYSVSYQYRKKHSKQFNSDTVHYSELSVIHKENNLWQLKQNNFNIGSTSCAGNSTHPDKNSTSTPIERSNYLHSTYERITILEKYTPVNVYRIPTIFNPR